MALGHVLMTLLQQRPATGYELTKSFDELPGNFWQASHQQVYRELARLLNEGLLSFRAMRQADRPDKKIYALTRAGRIALEAWLSEPLKLRQSNDEGLVKMLGAVQLGSDGLRQQLEQQCDAHKQRLAMYRALEREHFPDGADAQPMFQRVAFLTLLKGIKVEQARLAWVRQSLALLKRWPTV